MKLLLISVAFAAVFAAHVLAAPQGPTVVELISIERNDHEDGGYDFKYELSDGTIRTEEGRLVGVGTENQTIAVSGSFQYPAPDGKVISLTYTADTEGFKAEGEHLPKAPEDPNAA